MDLEILHDYLVESRELLQEAQEDALRLEADPGNDEALASIFRAFHTIKGGAGFLEAGNLVGWAHDLEDLLDTLRSHRLPVTSARIDAILQGMDAIEAMFQELAQEREPSPGPGDLSRHIRALAAESGSPAEAAQAHGGESLAKAGRLPIEAAAIRGPASPLAAHEVRDPEAAEPNGAATPAVFPGSWNRPAPASAPAASAPARGSDVADSSLRVDASRLDALMNQVGELVLLRNRLTSGVSSLGKKNENLSRIAREMDLAVNDLQITLMRLRMQPCKRLFQQLPRVVRDVSRQLNKDVRLEVAGEDVEIDKAVVDALSGPMTHLVRNSLDHGIELPAVRVAANKPAAGVLRVAAIHLGDKVRIEVSDDGQGIDRRLVTQKAIDKGVITAEEAAHLSEQEALELVFRPGFSTRDQASDLSGRGVGMDVVKETTNRLRGRMSIQTQLGQGTHIAMEFPLTLAVLPVLYLRVRQDIYALPISTIDGLTELESARVHRLSGRAAYRFSGTQTVPLVDLGAILQDRPFRLDAETVEGVLTERGLFVVSEVLGNEDAVVKPMDFLTGRTLYQGATISGQGSVVLILDAGALGAAAGSVVEGAP